MAKAKSAKKSKKTVAAKKKVMPAKKNVKRKMSLKAKPTAKKGASQTPKKAVISTSAATSKPTVSLVGQAVPDLTLPATGGQQVNLRQLSGKKVVLYFYPKDMTPGCTIEGHEFSKLKDDFASRNTVIFGVSRDPVQLHEKFKEKECYTIELLSDAEEKLCNQFGVIKDKNMYGKMVRGIERSTFVIDEKGQVAQEWRGVKAEGHAAQVFDYLKTM